MKVAFLDRDGTLIFEPQDTFQVDRVDLVQVLPGVIEGLQTLVSRGYALVLVTNQDGLGTDSFPRAGFEAAQNKMLEIFKANEIHFLKVFICPHFPSEACLCRKPKLGLVEDFIKTLPLDFKNSLMIGDRETDHQFAENLGISFISMPTNGSFPLPLLV